MYGNGYMKRIKMPETFAPLKFKFTMQGDKLANDSLIIEGTDRGDGTWLIEFSHPDSDSPMSLFHLTFNELEKLLAAMTSNHYAKTAIREVKYAVEKNLEYWAANDNT